MQIQSKRITTSNDERLGSDSREMHSDGHLVITVPGISTFGDWQHRVEEMLRQVEPDVEVYNYTYHSISLKVLMLFWRPLLARRLRSDLLHEVNRRAWKRVDIVAHSLGTKLAVTSLGRLRPQDRPRVHTIILAASVLRTGFSWDHLLEQSVYRVVNECGLSDSVLKLLTWLPFVGPAGFVGFEKLNTDRFKNRWFPLGHSGFFERGGKPYSEFMREEWVPLLTGEGPIRSSPHPRPSRWLVSVFKYLGPFKLTLYPLLVSLLAFEGFHLIQNVKSERRVAVSRELAAQSVSHLGGRLDLALLLSVEAYGHAKTLEARNSLLTVLQQQPQLSAFLHGQNSPSNTVLFAPSGTMLVSGNEDGTITVWTMATRERVDRSFRGHRSGIVTMTFSHDGGTLTSASRDGTIIQWDFAEGRELRRGSVPGLTAMALMPDGRILAAGNEGKIALWNFLTGQPVVEPFGGGSGNVKSLATSPDGRTLASLGSDGAIFLWDVKRRKPLGPLSSGAPFRNTSLAFRPDGRVLVSGTDIGSLVFWQVATRSEVGELSAGPPVLATRPGVLARVSAVAFSPDGRTLVAGRDDGRVIMYPADTTESPRVLTVHRGEVRSLAFSPDAATLASGGLDQAVILWSRETSVIGERLVMPTAAVFTVALSKDGGTLASASWNGTIILWDVIHRQQLRQVSVPGLTSMALMPNGRVLAAASGSKIRLFASSTGEPISEPSTGYTGNMLSLAFSPDGRTLASGSADRMVKLWDVETGQQKGSSMLGHAEAVVAVAFSPDGRMLASGSWDKTIVLWDVATQRQLGPPLVGHLDHVQTIAFSPDGRILASGSWDHTTRLWDVATHSQILQLITQGDRVLSVAFSPDGRTVAASSDDETTVLSDVLTGSRIGRPLSGHEFGATSLAFSADARTLVSGGLLDDVIILWDVDPDSWRDRACRIANRNLSRSEWEQFVGKETYRETCLSHK